MESNMAKFKHNKLKNTGMLFEFLLRQVTVDVLNKEKNSVALQIIKKRFNEHTEVGKELALYNLLLKKKFKDDKKADFFLSEILRQRGKLNESSLNREKYNIIKEVNDKYDAKSLFSAKLGDYKSFASIYKLFEGKEKLSPDDKTDSYFIIMENITTFDSKSNKSHVPKEMQDKDIRVLAYKKLLEKFNYNNILPDSFERFHLQSEITKVCYEEKESKLGDPNFTNIDVEKLLTDEFINILEKNIYEEIDKII